MPGLDMHDDEIRARLGMPIGEGILGRIEAHVVRAMPEPQAVEEIEATTHPKEHHA